MTHLPYARVSNQLGQFNHTGPKHNNYARVSNLLGQFNHMGPKHNKFQITYFTCGIINKANLAYEALDVTCLKFKKV